MTVGSFRFEDFMLDLTDRRLSRGGRPIALNGRYLDALGLLVREQGKLISKDRFLDEVWRGIPVTDEALTQCIKTLRRQLGDSANNPHLIETVPKHGYRFIAPVECVQNKPDDKAAEFVPSGPDPQPSWTPYLLTGAAGTIGGGVAGVFGGLFYGFAGAPELAQPGIGALSVLLVLISVSTLVALIGAAGVALGIASAGFLSGRLGAWSIAGGALGGLIVGAFVKLLGLDAFTVLFGHSPGDITGAAEGGLLGAAVGTAAWLGSRGKGRFAPYRSTAIAALAGGVTGILIPLLGGRMMGGSLDLLIRSFPGSRLQLDGVGKLFGENGFGFVSQLVTGGIEGALFSACVAAAMMFAYASKDKS